MTRGQQKLFDDAAPWDEDEAAERLVATVVFPTGPQQPFDYRVPDRLRSSVEPGCRVRAPLGRANRSVDGYCVKLESLAADSRRLKDLAGVVDGRRLLSPSMLRLTQWIAEHYLAGWGQVLETVVPAGVREQAGTRVTTLLSVPNAVAARMTTLGLPKKQARVLEILAACPAPITPPDLARAAQCTLAPINALRKRGLIQTQSRRMRQGERTEAAVPREQHLELNADQRAALDAILAPLNAGRHETILLRGVTGSGKTEVYIQAIQEVLGFGRQAIVLVPEISLTPQTEERFRSRFDRVAVLHSHLADADRHRHWERIAAGEVQVVVGARSAVFAPVPHLGLIVLDEEHESSFKQENAPRYHARDVALERACAEGVPLVLGSATPSLESWRHAREGVYRLVEMPRRVFDRPMPAVSTIDLRLASRDRRSRGAISRQLHLAMGAALKEGGQVILLLNRRGFSTHIQCPACGMVVRCPNCDIALTHHRHEEIALCHYCDHEIPAPRECPDCKFAGIRYSGQGTQRLEAEVRARFPDYPCLRMDTDTMRRPGSHQKALAAFRAGTARILVGTQMIAKGLDFPNVTLVGVINADVALHLPDFRAAERTFQLVTQVAGRTGRGDKGGRVLVQTFSPDHPAIQAATRHDYRAFAGEELPIREMLSYPPFSAMIRLVIRGPQEAPAARFAAELAARLGEAIASQGTAARILGPAPAPITRLRGNYRFQIQLQGTERDRLRAAVRQATGAVKPPDEVQWIVDVDPLDML
ncbi:MAG: replication restart helicase PriA [Pirellulales bacterium]